MNNYLDILRILAASFCISFGIIGGGFLILWFGHSVRMTAIEKAERKARGEDE